VANKKTKTAISSCNWFELWLWGGYIYSWHMWQQQALI